MTHERSGGMRAAMIGSSCAALVAVGFFLNDGGVDSNPPPTASVVLSLVGIAGLVVGGTIVQALAGASALRHGERVTHAVAMVTLCFWGAAALVLVCGSVFDSGLRSEGLWGIAFFASILSLLGVIAFLRIAGGRQWQRNTAA